jgi:hypothetical protein
MSRFQCFRLNKSNENVKLQYIVIDCTGLLWAMGLCEQIHTVISRLDFLGHAGMYCILHICVTALIKTTYYRYSTARLKAKFLRNFDILHLVSFARFEVSKFSLCMLSGPFCLNNVNESEYGFDERVLAIFSK